MKMYLLLGGNEGDRLKYLDAARLEIAKRIGEITRVSSLYESEPWGFEADQLFVNQVIEVETSLNPTLVLEKIHMIENLLGRTRTGSGYASRTIDIDILTYGSWIIIQHNLVIPHKHLPARRFALLPLVELAPELKHPVLNVAMKEILEQCKDEGSVYRVSRQSLMHRMIKVH